MAGRGRRVGALLALGAAVLAFAPSRAGASCIGPATVLCEPGATSCPDPVSGRKTTAVGLDRGQVVRVVGAAFGTTCNDAHEVGQPTEPVLGTPARGITIRLVRPDGTSQDLARVDASADYRFDVEVQVPPGATPGPAVLVASGETFGAPVTISSEAVTGDVRPATTLAPPTTPRPSDSVADGKNNVTPAALGIGTLIVVAGIAIVVVGMRSRRSR